MKIIKIFLASSDELKDDRVSFGDFISGLDQIYEGKGKRVKVFKWEFHDAAHNDRRKQDEYNDEVRTSDMFLALFYTKAGKFTKEEFNVAMEAYRKNKYPKVYVCCRVIQQGDEETPELQEFKNELSKPDKEYFWINYQNQDQLQLHFIREFLKIDIDLDKLKLEGDKVMLEGIAVAELANLSFAAGNKNYREMKEELDELELILMKLAKVLKSILMMNT